MTKKEEYYGQQFDKWLLDGLPTRFSIDNDTLENEIEWIVNWLCDKTPHAFVDMYGWRTEDKVECRIALRTEGNFINIL